MVLSGRLTETLSFYEIVETQSATGYKHSEERFMFDCKAEKIKFKERFDVDAEEIFHHVVPQFRMRYRAQVKETNVVQWRDEKYRIISVDRYPLDNEMVIKLDKINE